MYKIFIRKCGSSSAPDEDAYDVLNPPEGAHVHVIFDPDAPDVAMYVQSPKLNMSATEAGACTFTILYGHPFYSELTPYGTEVLVYEYNTCIWIGRVVDVDTDMRLSKSITAEGALAALNDIYTDGKNASSDVPRAWFLDDIFDVYIRPYLTSAMLPTVKQSNTTKFIIDNQYLDPNHTMEFTFEDGFDYCSIKELLDQIQTKYGGYFYIEPGPSSGQSDTIYAYLKYSETVPEKLISSQLACTFTAKMDANITDISQDANIDQFATVIKPLGARIKDPTPQYGDVEVERYDGSACTTIPTFPISPYDLSKADGYFYVWDFVSSYGWIEKTIAYDDIGPNDQDSDPIRIANELAVEAATDLAQCLMQVVGTSITFNALMDSEATARDSTGTIPSIPRVFDGVKVTSTIHGISITTPIQILDLSVDMLKPYESTISLSVSNYKVISKLIK